ncbi:MAG: caspase family protein [Clostridium sp.]|nr:caspase family protein [Prevotella sp.]MCM1428668.1 caspase family protein [Clostridium sp.]MCM1475797.1 caspase family protein [Muribaculaceae bacterium]
MAVLTLSTYCQTFHAFVFSDKTEQGREFDRTADYNEMSQFFCDIADVLGYKADIRCHSGSEFTRKQYLKDLDNLTVNNGDIVIMYYNGHGNNWRDTRWPHLALRDGQYAARDAFGKLKAKTKKAKFVMFISDCCNNEIDRRDYIGEILASHKKADLSPERVRKLFTGFEGRQQVMTSASKQGFESLSLIAGPYAGSIFGRQLRNAIAQAVLSGSSSPLDWDSVMQNAVSKTKIASNGRQTPQYEIITPFSAQKQPKKQPQKQPKKKKKSQPKLQLGEGWKPFRP